MNYQDLLEVINALVQEIERKTCTHEETHRGGTLWEICDACGAKWADDAGGKPKFKWPDAVIKARELLGKPVPQIPWVRVLDEEMVSTHQGVASGDDSYAEAKKKLSMIINWHVDVANDPAVNGGKKPWPKLDEYHLLAITFAYEKGFAAGLNNRHMENIFAPTGSVDKAFEIGVREGKSKRDKV